MSRLLKGSMRRSTVCAVRSLRSMVPSFLRGDSAKPTSAEAAQRSPEHKEAISRLVQEVRLDKPRSLRPSASEGGEDLDEILDKGPEMDSIRARSLLKYTYNYVPAKNVHDLVLSEVASVLRALGRSDDPATLRFDRDVTLKFQTLNALASRLQHAPLSGDLVHLKTVADVIEFYEKPVRNITEYQQLARSKKLPPNAKFFEQPVRFHPDDKEAWHGGITASPGVGGKVFSQRHKRLIRQFRPKEEWFEYEEQNFDHTRPDKDMPWDPEIARKMDRYPDRRYNLKTRAFRLENKQALKDIEL